MFEKLKALFFGKEGSSANSIEPAPEEAELRGVTTPPDADALKREQREPSTPVGAENNAASSHDRRSASGTEADRKTQFQRQPVRVREVRVEMLPLQQAEHLVNFADNIDAIWFNADNGQLRLQFQFVSLFKDARVQRVWLGVGHAADKVALAPKRGASPHFGQKYATIAWAAQSRFYVDEIVMLPRAFSGALTLDLLAEAGGTYRKIGLIRPAAPDPGR